MARQFVINKNDLPFRRRRRLFTLIDESEGDANPWSYVEDATNYTGTATSDSFGLETQLTNEGFDMTKFTFSDV